jgi:hypothetical protein
MTHGDDLRPFQQWYQDRKARKGKGTYRNDVTQDRTAQDVREKDNNAVKTDSRENDEMGARKDRNTERVRGDLSRERGETAWTVGSGMLNLC